MRTLYFDTMKKLTKRAARFVAAQKRPKAQKRTQYRPAIGNLVIDDIVEKMRMGKKKYGEFLRPFNGRDPLVDLYQELIDATKYVRQCLFEKYKK